MKLKRKYLYAAVLILIPLLLIPIILKVKEPNKEKTNAPVPVKIVRVELKDIEKTLDYAGNIKAQDEVAVYPKVSGKIIEKVRQDGDIVSKGDTIAYIDRDEVGLKYEKAPIESPLSGAIGRIYVDIGSSVTPQEPVALVVNMDKVKIDLNIPEKYIPNISIGQNANIGVDAYPEKEFKGVITKISPVLDLDTRSAPCEITIENDGQLLQSGMFARVKLIIEQRKNVPVIPKEAIIGRQPPYYVYVIENDRAVMKNIELGIRYNSISEVTSGLKESDAVVIMGQQKLRDQAEVTTEE